MIQKAVPGYTELFGPPVQSYESLLQGVAPSTGILYCISLNGELNAHIPYQSNQGRIAIQALSVFTLEQKLIVTSNLHRLGIQRNDPAIGEIFHKHYLIAMLAEELNRNSNKEIKEIPTAGQFELLLAYFMVVEKENNANRPHLDYAISKRNEPHGEYRLLWMPLLKQYHLNEWVSPMFEIFKLFCLCKYSFNNWREHLKKYINAFDVETIGKFIGSYKSLFDASYLKLTNQPLRKFIRIGTKHEARHLQHLRINSLLGKKKISWTDLKKKPLFQLPDGTYIIIDKDFLHKHIFRGPFFDLLKSTKLKDSMSFNEYSQEVSSEVLEKIVFRSIMKLLSKDMGLLKFDENPKTKSGIPDCYYRINNIIFLIEYKAYIFPDDMSKNPDFDKFHKYLHEKFVKNNDEKPKGVGQLLNNLKTVQDGGYPFDPISIKENERIQIVPILIHNDFQFGMPGINDYLNENFASRLDPSIKLQLEIKPLTVINLDWIFDLSMRKGDFHKLLSLVDQYHSIISDRKTNFRRGHAIADLFIRSKESFDETYQFTFIHNLPEVAEYEPGIIELLNFSGLTQDILDEVV